MPSTTPSTPPQRQSSEATAKARMTCGRNHKGGGSFGGGRGFFVRAAPYAREENFPNAGTTAADHGA